MTDEGRADRNGNMFILRRATETDADFIFRVRNDPDTRAASRTTEHVSWETHMRWFTGTMTRQDRVLLIGEASGVPVSSVRFDYLPHGIEASWMVAPEARRKGYGSLTLREAVRYETRRPIIAEIKSENVRSAAMAKGVGFMQTGIVDGLHRFILQ